ncbi:hypothetical protein BD410DRAFT_879852 [Rickenella mellea]|uniref:Uncharacterized protein n=1 Tax=Rickenella mellea TaxID=50990 RepID=A0A4Y7PUC6_9AGAM|nr:hypothetical protein BD410DRAFT_879852 [Rickenella mellea]
MSDSSPDIAGLIAEASQFGAQALFFLARYSFMVSVVFDLSTNFITKQSEMKNKFILILLGLTGMAGVVDGILLEVCQRHSLSLVWEVVVVKLDRPLFLVQLAGPILSLIFDVLVFTLTFMKTVHHAIEMRKVGLGNGLGYFILRDGAVYPHEWGFRAKLLMGVVAVTVFFVHASVNNFLFFFDMMVNPAKGGVVSSWITIIASMGNPLTYILINRLVLNLRKVSHIQEGDAPTLGAISTIQEPVFAANSILGNLGAPLRMGTEDEYSDDEIEEIVEDNEVEVFEEPEIADHTEIIEEPRNPSHV